MHGFTLLECLIYIALFSVLMTGTLEGVVALTESIKRTQAQLSLETEGNFSIQEIEAQLMQTSVVIQPTQEAQSNKLELLLRDGTHVFIEPLLSGDVSITRALFEESGIGGIDPRSIHSTLTLSTHSASGQIISKDFSSVFYLLP
jgi:prepilin-type N-terminal cleavage/methylation domain-containing protein